MVNWTLSDTVTRLLVSVGVAYGSDIDQVVCILKEAIAKTPSVLQDPEPNVVFTGMGDNALLFDIHVFVHELTERVGVKHSLHKNIYEALQSNHIEIPFPQRDVYIRSVNNVTLPV